MHDYQRSIEMLRAPYQIEFPLESARYASLCDKSVVPPNCVCVCVFPRESDKKTFAIQMGCKKRKWHIRDICLISTTLFPF